jgi:MFS family permease
LRLRRPKYNVRTRGKLIPTARAARLTLARRRAELNTLEIPTTRGPSRTPSRAATRYGVCAVIGLGGLFAGVTGPLLSTFIPPLVRDILGDHRTAIGAVMALDNLLLLVLVPWAGPTSDRARSRMPFVLGGLVLSSVGMALLPASAGLGLPVLIAALVLLYAGINVQRAPFQALLADAVPSRDRPLATASVTFQMCVGAIAFLMLGQALGMRTSFLIAAVTILAIAAALRVGVREPATSHPPDEEVSFGSLARATWSTLRGSASGMRAIFLATLLLQLTFQTFTTWFSLHATERYGVRPEEVALGFIAWAVGGVLGALPAGYLGVRFGRRNAILAGFALMTGCLFGLNQVTQLAHAVPLLALASAAWTLPTVNAYPLFVELVPRPLRGVLASLYLLCMGLGGAIGDPFNGVLFDLFGGYGPLFLVMASYTALAFLAVLLIPRGIGEADTGPDASADRDSPARDFSLA